MNVRHNTRTGSQAMNERDCIRTLTVWTCEFARQNLAAWPLSTTDSMNRSHENNNSIASHCAMVWWLQVLDQGPATRWDVAANNGTCRSRLSGSSGGLRKTCMCKTACGQQWESAFDSDCSGVQLLSQLTYISLPSSNTHNNSSLQHSKTSTKYLDPDQKPPTLKRGAPSPHICTLGSSSEPHLPLRCGDRISKST